MASDLTVNNLVVVKSTELDAYWSTAMLDAADIDDKVGTARQTLLDMLAGVEVQEAEVAEVNGATGLTGRQEELRYLGAAIWLRECYRKLVERSGDGFDRILKEIKEVVAEQRKLKLGPPVRITLVAGSTSSKRAKMRFIQIG